jgi:hypothetical protein
LFAYKRTRDEQEPKKLCAEPDHVNFGFFLEKMFFIYVKEILLHLIITKPPVMKKLLFLLVASIFSITLFAYPITPRPLRKLIIESQYIVWGKVVKVDALKPDKKKERDYWEREFALLAITETLQGKLNTDTVRVFFTSGMICPAPGVFYEGEEALAFLDKKEKTNDYYVHALSYGVKHGLDAEGYATYKSRITEMQAILRTQDSKTCNEKVVDWLVRCAEKAPTRWEGLYELSPGSDFMSYYDRGEFISRDIIISTANRKKLFEAMLKIDTLDYADIGLADMTMGINDSVLLGFLKSKLLLFDNGDYYWTAADVMKRIVLLTDDAELEKLLEKLKKVYFGYSEKEKKEAKEIFENFIIKMKDVPLKVSPTAAGDFST